ncbi:MAG: hypothetical protein N2748_02625 [candidate division WOR-3 bacterium]|nr:hypothetical protein [candidate division WOR-3 bacterium]
MMAINEVIDTKSAQIRDERVTQGEAVVLILKENITMESALPVVINDLIKFLTKTTGRMYIQQRESYSNSYRICEPGHQSYGLKVIPHLNKILIQPIAVFIDVDILRQYVQRLRRME